MGTRLLNFKNRMSPFLDSSGLAPESPASHTASVLCRPLSSNEPMGDVPPAGMAHYQVLDMGAEMASRAASRAYKTIRKPKEYKDFISIRRQVLNVDTADHYFRFSTASHSKSKKCQSSL